MNTNYSRTAGVRRRNGNPGRVVFHSRALSCNNGTLRSAYCFDAAISRAHFSGSSNTVVGTACPFGDIGNFASRKL